MPQVVEVPPPREPVDIALERYALWKKGGPSPNVKFAVYSLGPGRQLGASMFAPVDVQEESRRLREGDPKRRWVEPLESRKRHQGKAPYKKPAGTAAQRVRQERLSCRDARIAQARLWRAWGALGPTTPMEF